MVLVTVGKGYNVMLTIYVQVCIERKKNGIIGVIDVNLDRSWKQKTRRNKKANRINYREKNFNLWKIVWCCR